VIDAAPTPSVAEALTRIGVDDDPLQAWTFVDVAAGDTPAAAGPLSGMPFGVKDIIDVRAMPTACGLARTPRVSELDAWCVAVLRAAGAVPVGKTHTTACAHRDPAPTYNPLDAARTPGGSSAGSAAAVAAGHVPFALGTQTIGSVLRPAAYCGVVGFKPSYGRIPTTGVAPFAPSLDHVGFIAADVATAERVARCAISGLEHVPPRGAVRLAVADAVWSAERAPQTRESVRRALGVLREHGIDVMPQPMPVEVAAAVKDAYLVNAFEAHAVLAPLLAGELPPKCWRAAKRCGRASTRSSPATTRSSSRAQMKRQGARRPATAHRSARGRTSGRRRSRFRFRERVPQRSHCRRLRRTATTPGCWPRRRRSRRFSAALCARALVAVGLRLTAACSRPAWDPSSAARS
jgi:Asp-tRNA(Asn)/Glu-tRNA(Gln) amidotransferase A subunit family amidase